MSLSTITKVLQDASALNNRGITFIEQGDREDFLSYHELYELSLKGLYALQQRGLKPKDELVFQVEDNRAFIIIFWSCILGGIIPVPLSIGKNDDQKAKFFNVWGVLDNPYLVCTAAHLEKIAGYGLATGQEHLYVRIRGKAIDLNELETAEQPGIIHQANPTDLAFIQFSSGSTGSPKGVMLTHENLITNVVAIGSAAAYATTDTTLSWMPLTHDMGLIGFHINPLFSQMNQYLMPTSLFVRNPTLWLTKATAHQTTVICSPNFGYKYLLKYYDESKTYGWDLSAVRIIYNGAEPISEELGFSFLDVLAKFGLRKTAMCPVYGLAEACLAVSISKLDAEMLSLALDRNELQVGSQIKPAGVDNALSFVNVGTAINDVFLNIADDEGHTLANNVIGHVCIKGKNVTAGYYNNPAATSKVISADGWLDTGDLGFMKGGELYITGRAKDVFFINGQNFYPHDLERVAEAVEGVDLNKIIISGTGTDAAIEEVISFVFHRGDVRSFIPIIQALKAHINIQTGVELAHVIPVKDIPKTTSGKLQRFKLVERYKAGEHNQVIQEIAAAERAAAGAVSTTAQPQNETEQELLRIWQELFDKPELSVTDKFFEIGGNSLKAAEFAMIVLKRYEVELPLAAMYDQQSVREIAALLGSLEKTNYQAIPESSETACQPVSALQRRLFYFQETNPSSTAYNVPVAFETSTAIDLQKLQSCAEQLVAQYDVLRSSFYENGQAAFIKVHPNVEFEIEAIEADFTNPGFFDSLMRPFDVKQPELFKLCLVQNADGKTMLFFDFHHIIMDGVSISFFAEELIQRYLGKNLRKPAAQYADFIQWSEAHWHSTELQARKQFWLHELAGELPLLEMPLDQPRPKQFDHNGEKLAFKISKVKSEKLRALAMKQDCSMHALMFTAYNLLLHKYTGQQELVIGIPVTSRNHPDISRSLGMFVNNLAIKVRINPEDSFEALLDQQMKLIGHAMQQDYPFDLLLNELEIKRDISRNPVFDTMFLYQNMDLPSSVEETLQLKPFPVNPKTSKFDISQEVFDHGSGPLTYHIEFATALFKLETIQKLTAHFDTLLDRLLLNPSIKIADFSLLSVEEYQTQVFGFNNTSREFSGQSVLDLIDAQAAATPDRTAIIYGQTKLSYQKLASQSNAIASSLQARGLQKGDIVALYMNRSPELVLGMLAILKAGGVYLPVDTDLPQKRVHYLLTHSKSKCLLTKAKYKQALSALGSTETDMLEIGELLIEGDPKGITTTISCSDLAYLLYTSGTTGMPKGVKVTHSALHNYISWAGEQYVGKDGGTFPLFTSISFDLTITSIFTPLATGHAIVVYDEEEHDHEHAIIRALTDNQVDIIKLTPSHLRLLRNIDLSDSGELRLQKMILGGESLDTKLAAEIHEKFGGKLTLFNEYGPTEATVGCMIHTFEPTEKASAVPIGVPAANTQIYVLNEQYHLMPEGAKGEVYIAGTGLAAGYLFDEDLSAEKFIANPFVENERMYKTGDIARRRPDGILEYVGRVDEQVKINGYRIEVDEINHHLRQYPGVTDSVVLASDANGRKSLFAYLLTEEAADTIEEAALKSHLAEHLPFYMIPSRLISLHEFPITGNGKIDQQALAAMKEERADAPPQLPASEVELIFAAAWQGVLGIENVALDDNFFELGGDSIKAVQIGSRLHEKGFSVQVKDILTYHTIAQLVTNEKYTHSGQMAQQGVISGIKAKTPIESWFFNQQLSNPSFYNQSVLLNINQPLELDLLQKAFETLIRHHDGLRLNYNPADDQLFYNEHHLTAEFRIVVLPEEADFTTQLAGLKSGFDIAESLLLKAAVFQENGRQKYLFITAHHLVTDGVSWRIMLHDLSKVYEALLAGKEHAMAPKTASLAAWQHQLSNWQPENEDLSRQYWKEANNASFALPADKIYEDWAVTGIQQHTVQLNEEYTDFLIKEAHKPYRTGVFTLLNVALAQALHGWTGQRQLVIEHENHGRQLDHCDVSRTMGWFTAMYPVKLELTDQDLGGQIKAIKEQIKQIPDHGISFGIADQQYPISNPQPSEVRLNYLGEFTLENERYWSFSAETTGPETALENHLTTKLEINAMVMNQVLTIELAYHSGTFAEQTIQVFGSELKTKLIQLLKRIGEESDVHFTPSDFAAELDQEELDELFM